jgi:hypothetical protein
MSAAEADMIAKMAPAVAASAPATTMAKARPTRVAVKAPPRPAVVNVKAAPAVTPASAFSALQEKGKAVPITTTGKAPRLLSGATQGAVQPRRPLFGEDGIIAGTRSAGTRAAASDAIRRAAEAPGASQLAKDRYLTAMKSGMYANGGKVGKYAAGGAGKVRKGCAPIKRKQGGTTMQEGVSTRPTDKKGRRITMQDLERANRDTGGMSASDTKKAGEAVARGNRVPREPIPKAKGGAAKVRKGMMSQTGNILKAVKPKKGIGGIM